LTILKLLPNFSANHVCFIPFSLKTSFILFISIVLLKYGCKYRNYFWIKIRCSICLLLYFQIFSLKLFAQSYNLLIDSGSFFHCIFQFIQQSKGCFLRKNSFQRLHYLIVVYAYCSKLRMKSCQPQNNPLSTLEAIYSKGFGQHKRFCAAQNTTCNDILT
jgi:hypothetical protein